MRGDVVFKYILRQMRRMLFIEFNHHSNYSKIKTKSEDLLMQSLDSFADKILLGTNSQIKVSIPDLTFFLGALMLNK